MPYGLYIHIPYCTSRCRYCDFYSTGGNRAVPQAYVDAVLRDFARYAPRDAKGAPQRPASVYFGGGTPGLLDGEQVARMLDAFRPLPHAEVTLEANPGSADRARMAAWRQAGANRLSLGVQTARDDSLARLGRPHTARQAAEAFADATAAGFAELSGDIMLALPEYSEQEFDETLALLEAGGATHVSAYMLKLEPGTAFGDCPPAGLPDGDTAAGFYNHAARQLARRGYQRYEISNFARPGHPSRHNLLYWEGGSWLGIGPAAHSCLQGRRFSFAPDLAGFLAGRLLPQPEGDFTADDYVMLRLRLAAGLEEAELARRYGVGFTPAQQSFLRQLQAVGLAQWEQGVLRLTGEGMLVQNTILVQLGEMQPVCSG